MATSLTTATSRWLPCPLRRCALRHWLRARRPTLLAITSPGLQPGRGHSVDRPDRRDRGRGELGWPFLVILLITGYGYLLGLGNYGVAEEGTPDAEDSERQARPPVCS